MIHASHTLPLPPTCMTHGPPTHLLDSCPTHPPACPPPPCTYRHDDGAVLRLWPQPQGSRLVFEDEKGNLCLFNPVNDQVRCLGF